MERGGSIKKIITGYPFQLIFSLLFSAFILFTFFSLVNSLRLKYDPVSLKYAERAYINIVIFSTRTTNYDAHISFTLLLTLTFVYFLYNHCFFKNGNYRKINLTNIVVIVLLSILLNEGN